MTQVLPAPRTPRTAALSRSDIERLLRDVAFALRLGRQAAREIRGERASPPRPVAEGGRPVCAAV